MDSSQKGDQAVSPALAGRFLATGPPGKPQALYFYLFYHTVLPKWQDLLVPPKSKLVGVKRVPQEIRTDVFEFAVLLAAGFF